MLEQTTKVIQLKPSIFGAGGGAPPPGQGFQQPAGEGGQWFWGGAPAGGDGAPGVPTTNGARGMGLYAAAGYGATSSGGAAVGVVLGQSQNFYGL